LSGKTIFKECIKLFSLRLRKIIFIFFFERGHPMLLNDLSDLKMFGLRWMAKKLNLLKSKLKVWNRDVFGHLDTKLGDLVEKVKVLDAMEHLSLYLKLRDLRGPRLRKRFL